MAEGNALVAAEKMCTALAAKQTAHDTAAAERQCADSSTTQSLGPRPRIFTAANRALRVAFPRAHDETGGRARLSAAEAEMVAGTSARTTSARFRLLVDAGAPECVAWQREGPPPLNRGPTRSTPSFVPLLSATKGLAAGYMLNKLFDGNCPKRLSLILTSGEAFMREPDGT